MSKVWGTAVLKGSVELVRIAMCFRSAFVEICNHSHILKVMTLLNTKTNVAILIENFLAAIFDFEYGRHQISIFVNYSVTK